MYFINIIVSYDRSSSLPNYFLYLCWQQLACSKKEMAKINFDADKLTLKLCLPTNNMDSLARWVECSPKIRETWVQSQVVSNQRFKKWYFISPCLTLSNIRYISRV